MAIQTLNENDNGEISRGKLNDNFSYLEGIIPSVASGASAPAGTPTVLGQIYIETTNKNVYIAVGTSSAADWKILAAL